jgi:hypothetical protein
MKSFWGEGERRWGGGKPEGRGRRGVKQKETNAEFSLTVYIQKTCPLIATEVTVVALRVKVTRERARGADLLSPSPFLQLCWGEGGGGYYNTVSAAAVAPRRANWNR